VKNATFVVGTAKNLYNYGSEFGAQIDLEFHRYLAERGDLYSAGEWGTGVGLVEVYRLP
jgi:hypothetical protein